MACSGEMVNVDKELDDIMEDRSRDEEERCTPHCWPDAQLEAFYKETKRKLFTLKNVIPPVLQFLVQRQNAELQRLAQKQGLCFHLDSSKLYPTVKSIHGGHTEQEFDGMIEKFVESIKYVCNMYSIKGFDIEDNAWPYVEKEFNEQAKSYLEESILQVYKKCKGTYCLIGLSEKFEKYESLLSSLSRQYKAISIENRELFDVLEIEKNLDSRFKRVKIAVQDDLLLLHGEEEVVKECAIYYEELSKRENMHFAKRFISENVYKFLKRKQRRQEIYRCLFEKGIHVYWSVEKQNEICNLDCRCISEIPERGADFIINCLAKEIEFEESYLQIEPVDQRIKEMENAKLFSQEGGLKTIVFCGNWNLWEKAEADGAKRKFWFYHSIANSELTFLARIEVQKFINSKLGYPADVWSIIQEKRKIKIYCQCLAEVDNLVSSILNQVWLVIRPAEFCHNDLVAKFCKHHSDFVEMKWYKKYFTIFVTVDLKDELEKLLCEQSKRKPDGGAKVFERCFENPTERLTLFLKPEIREYLTKSCVAEMTKIQEDFKVCLSFKETNLEFRANSTDNILCAKQAVLHLLEGISYQSTVVRIRRDWTYEHVKEEMDELERKHSCIVTLEEKKYEEPNYLKCWAGQNIRIVAAEGSLEDTMCDVLICFLDENLQPVRRSAKKIFMTGEWTELEDAVKSSKEVGKSRILKTSKCKVFSSRAAGFLKCKQLLFISSDDLKRDIEEMWNKVLENANENHWRSICFPVDSSLMNSVAELMSILAFGVSWKLESYLELQICIWDTKDQLRGHTLDICHQYLSSEVYHPIHFLDDKTEMMQTTKKGWHSIEVKLEKGSLLEVAEAKKVDVIVNSANPELDLSQGYVSKIICEKGGQGIEDELKTKYKDGIQFGDIAISSGHSLEIKAIFHGALYRWFSTGNLSIKVLKCFINKCLLAMERRDFHTIAFPALGTGRLGYPYIRVAKAIMECVTEFGKQHPETCIQTVYIVVRDQDKHCLQVFEDVFENPDITSQSAITDILLKPTISCLENRIPERNLLIQLLPEEIHEVVDAVIIFSSKESRARDVDFRWCSKMGCYSAVISVTKEHLQIIVDQCFRMMDSKRITSARVNLADFMKDSEMFTAMIEAFLKILTKNIDKHSPGLSLRKLQFLLCKKEFEKMEHTLMDPKHHSWFWNLIRKDPSNTWRKKTVNRQRDVLVSVFGPSRDHVKRVLNEFRESASATGNWCVWKDFKWAFVSSIINTKLNQAVEQGLQNVEIKEEDGIYDYNFENLKRYPAQEKGDKRDEKIRCLPYEENKAMPTWIMLWYVLQENKWVLLPEKTCRMLTDAGQVESVSDEQHIYNLKICKRTPIGKHGKSEEIMSVKAREDDKASGGTNTSKEMQSSRKGFNLTDEEKEEDLQIFDFVTGQITYPDMGNDTQKNEVKRKLESVGCKVTFIKDWTFCIKGSFSQITRVNELKMTPVKESVFLDSSNLANIVYIPMSERDFKVFCFFGNKCQWFKKYGNHLQHDGQNLNCDIPRDEEESVKTEMETHLKEVKMMCAVQTEIDRKKGYNLSTIIQKMQKEYPNVCLVENEKDIEMISENYEDLMKVQALLNHQMVGKMTKRVGRTFEKTEYPEQQGELQSSNDVYRRQGSTENRCYNTTQRLKELEVKTKEGLKIKIYTGSIIRLNVDCIVNAANDRLMHGGGVAAAISEAAGYKFDQASRDYVQKNGPIPVGSCCVTSAGNLQCKLVIHTVGPRWDDYTDKNRCLQVLHDSVEVTFIEANKRGMNSIAIPAISSGIFAIPRDLCVQQYYKAVMSFSRNYAFQSLQEIHFVDKDESMVRAIQEVFQPKEPHASNTVKSGHLEKKNDTPAFGAENSVYSTTPLSNAFTIVDVSENLQIKIHIGNITDVVADAIVCPQDEYCHSEDVIARDIFKVIPAEKPVSKKMKLENIFPQQLQKNSQWKMIIHAVAPVYDEKHAKDSTKFGKALNTIIQFIMKMADEEKVESIAIPLLGTGIGEYKTPVNTCAYNFAQAVMAKKSELMFLKDIYLVLKNNEDEKIYLENFEIHKCEITKRTLVDSGNLVSLATTLRGTSKDVDNCCICMDPPTNPKQLKKCGHIFCKECIDASFQYKPACPSCGLIYGKVTGDQPPGLITMKKSYTKLEGFNDSSGSIILTYMFVDGYQGEEHSEPGKRYRGISRSGYVPNNQKGKLVAKLLNVAFSRRLVFTIGRSRTTGHDGVITWNDIHHKTRPDGGAAKFGYPDPTYLDRVLEELEAKGVTEESADDPEEYKEYSKLFRY